MAVRVPEEGVPPVAKPADFDAFWSQTLTEARSYGLDPSLIDDGTYSTRAVRVQRVAFTSLERVRVGGWYCVPRGQGPFPAVLLLPGYGSHASLAGRAMAQEGIASLFLAVRGHSFGDQITPGFPGFLCHNITDKYRYIYRGAYCDAVLGLDFLAGRMEVDGRRTAVAGGSQGGALAIVAAALAGPERVAAAAPDVPFLTNFKFSVARSPSYPFAEIADLLRRYPDLEERVWEALAYFDVANFAPKVECPTLISVALKDDICPPASLLAMAATIKGQVDVRKYPDAGHEGGGLTHATLKLKWLKERLGA